MTQPLVRSDALWAALPAVAGFITDKTGIPIYRGAGACTDGSSITLPALPDGLLAWSEIVKAIAYLYHETAHILKTDFADWQTIATPLERAIMGVLEDIRIELYAVRRFPAARKYLGDLVRQLAEAGMAGKQPCFCKVDDQHMSEAEVMQWYMLYRLRHDILEQKGIAPVLETAAAAMPKKFPAGMRIRLDGLMYQIADCESTRDALDLTAEIIKMIKEEKEKEDKKQDNSSGKPPSQQLQAGGASSQEAGNGKPEQGPQETGAGDDGAGTASGSQGPGADGLGKLLGMGNEQVAQDLGSMLQESLNQIATQKCGRATSMPNVWKLPLAEKPADIAGVKASINAIRTKTLHWMHSAAQTDLRHVRSGLTIDASSLHLAPVGGDIFVEEDEGIDLNAAISIVIDRSSSMSRLIGSAAQAALAAMLAFDMPGIKTNVAVFPVHGNAKGVSDHNGVAVVKRWEESPRNLARRITSLTACGGTPMAEAILFAAADVLRREETLRLVMVVTDGEPNDEDATREMIDKARASGINVVGLGIGVDPSPVFGERNAAKLENVQQLSGAMVRLIRASIQDR